MRSERVHILQQTHNTTQDLRERERERETYITTQKISSTMGMGICHSKMADFETNSVEETKNPF